jgi:hypothetical protein
MSEQAQPPPSVPPRENPGTGNPALPWQTAAFAIVQQVQSGVPFGTADMSAIIESACVGWAEQQTAALRAENQKLAEEIKWRTEHMAITDHEICQMEDWLCGNAEFDKNGLIDKANRCKERIRDLIAAEGELGDLRAQNDALAASVARLREALEVAQGQLRAMRKSMDSELPLPSRVKLTQSIESINEALAAAPPPALAPDTEVQRLVQAARATLRSANQHGMGSVSGVALCELESALAPFCFDASRECAAWPQAAPKEP